MYSQTLTKKQVVGLISTELKKFYLDTQIIAFIFIILIITNIIFPFYTMITTTILGLSGLTYLYLIYKRINAQIRKYKIKYGVSE